MCELRFPSLALLALCRQSINYYSRVFSVLSHLVETFQLLTMIARYGVRNSLLISPMPTASTAQILGNNESIEPYTSNIYTRRVLSGEFQVSTWSRCGKELFYSLTFDNFHCLERQDGRCALDYLIQLDVYVEGQNCWGKHLTSVSVLFLLPGNMQNFKEVLLFSVKQQTNKKHTTL